MLKKIINTLAITASLAFTSAANAGLINSFDDSYLDSLVTGGSTVTQLLNNSIDYTFRDNFMVVDVNYANINYLVYEFSVGHEDGLDGTFLSNLYLPTGYTDAMFNPVEELLEVVFQFGKADGFKFALEIDNSLDFLGVDFNQGVGGFAFILSNDFQLNEMVSFGNPLIGAARADTVAVPEPSTVFILLLGIIGLLSRRFIK